jgi:DHA2 family multidrug resistance protein
VDGAHKTHNKWLVTVTVMTGAMMAALDTSIVNVALPHMRGALGASVEEIAWVSTGYILSSVIVMPIIALLISRFGRKRFFVFSVMLFTGSSMLCGAAWDLPSMVAFRVLQGIGGGALIPLAQALLRETFPTEEQATAMSLFGLGVILGPAFGPTLGGWLTDNYSWPWIFYINVPVGILNVLLIMRFIEDPPYLVREKGSMDAAGLFLMAVGLGSLQIMLEKGDQKDWFTSDMIRYLAVAALVGLILFVIRELSAKRPAVNLRILKDINFSSSSFMGGILSVGVFSSLFVLPLFLEQLLDYPAYNAGLALMPRSLAMALAMPFTGRIYRRTGPRLLIALGLLVNAVSFYLLSLLSLDVGYWEIFFPQFLQGIGFGLIFVALSTAVLSTIERPLMTAATGLYNVIRQVFASVGIALAATCVTRGEIRYRAMLVEHVTGYNDATTGVIARFLSHVFTSGAGSTGTDMEALGLLERTVGRQAGMLAYNHVFFLIAVLFLVSIPLAFAIRDPQVGRGAEIIAE